MAGDEFAFIDWIRERARPRDARVAFGIGDDMAGVRWADGLVLITSDMLLDGVHFLWNEQGPEAIGRKAICASVSDCAAMGALPRAATVSVALHRAVSMAEAQRLAASMIDAAGRYGCSVVGGDTTSWTGPTAIDVTMLAEVPNQGQPILRSGARAGDGVYVTGPLGGSILGRHLTFEPRVEVARQLAETGAVHAMLDISDGLAADLGHICQESGCGAVVEEPLLRAIISDDARRLAQQSGKDPLEHALHDGEDFELVLAGDAEGLDALAAQNVIRRVGRIVEGRGLQMRTAGGEVGPLEPKGYRHRFGIRELAEWGGERACQMPDPLAPPQEGP